MAELFAIILIAALVGIVRPFLRGLGRKHFAMIAVGAFVGLIITVPKSAGPSGVAPKTMNTTDGSDTKTTDRPEPVASASADAAVPESNWSYQEKRDEMRGSTARFASIESENEVDLDFPYGIQKGRITIRRRPEDGLNVMFSVGEGQILCHSFTRSTISVKFDNGPIRRMDCTSSSDGSSETAFIVNSSAALAGLKKAKRTVIEAEFFQKGRQQFVFDTEGLDWK